MDGVVQVVNVRVLVKGLELQNANGGRFECEWWHTVLSPVTINQLLFADGTVLVADSEEKLYILVSKFGTV